MALSQVGSFTIGEINVGLAASLGFLNPMALQLDLFISGQFGLGPFLADIQAQFNAAILAQATIGLQLTSPLLTIQALMMAAANIQAALQLVASLGLPTISLQLNLQLAATLALVAKLQLQIGGIKAMIAAAVNVKIPALRFIAEMQAAISAGPLHLLSFTGSTLSTTGGQINGAFSGGLGPSNIINPGDQVSGILLVTKDPAVFAALGAILKVS